MIEKFKTSKPKFILQLVAIIIMLFSAGWTCSYVYLCDIGKVSKPLFQPGDPAISLFLLLGAFTVLLSVIYSSVLVAANYGANNE